MWLIDAISLINMEHSSQSYHKEIKLVKQRKIMGQTMRVMEWVILNSAFSWFRYSMFGVSVDMSNYI